MVNGIAKLAVALGVAEWSTAYSHLNAMDRMGLHVPPLILGEVREELEELKTQWRRVGGRDFDADGRDEEEQARAYLTAHLSQVEELLKEGT